MRYDLASSSWRTSEATSLWDLEMSSPTFPEWGMTHGGELYELPTPALPTAAPASSSLPTTTARDYRHMGSEESFARRSQDHAQPLSEIANLLPTPRAGDGERGRDLPRMRADEKSRELSTAVAFMGEVTP